MLVYIRFCLATNSYLYNAALQNIHLTVMQNFFKALHSLADLTSSYQLAYQLVFITF